MRDGETRGPPTISRTVSRPDRNTTHDVQIFARRICAYSMKCSHLSYTVSTVTSDFRRHEVTARSGNCRGGWSANTALSAINQWALRGRLHYTLSTSSNKWRSQSAAKSYVRGQRSSTSSGDQRIEGCWASHPPDYALGRRRSRKSGCYAGDVCR